MCLSHRHPRSLGQLQHSTVVLDFKWISKPRTLSKCGNSEAANSGMAVFLFITAETIGGIVPKTRPRYDDKLLRVQGVR